MKSRFRFLAVFGLMLALGGVGGYFVCSLTAPEAPKDVRVVRQKVSEKGVKKITEITLGKKGGKTSVKIVEREQRRPDVVHVSPSVNDDVEEAELTELQKGILQELQKALDENNLKNVRKALSKFVAKADRGGLEGRVPKCMRQRAVEALGWFGKEAAVDLLEYVADVDEEVANDAFSQFELALQDCEMPAAERAELLTSTLKALNNAENIDSLLTNLNDLPNSLKATTVENILTTGSDQAKSVMTEQLEFYLDDEVKTVDDIRKWAAMNPDGN